MIVTLPKVLAEKLGPDGADALVHVLNDAEARSHTDLPTKADLIELKHSAKADLASAKAEILKWIVVMWIAQIGAIIGLFFKI